MDLVLVFVIYSSFYLAGKIITSLWEQTFSSPAEAFVFRTGLGLVLVTVLTTILAFAGGIYPVTPWIILGVIYLFSWRTLASLPRLVIAGLKTSSFRWKNLTWFDGFNLAALGLLIFLALTLALAPAIKTDALVYHLAVPKAYLENRGVILLPNNIYSFFPMQVEMLYLFCLALRGEVLAQLAGLGISFLLLLALTQYYKQSVSSRLAPLVPTLYFSTFTFFFTAHAAYVDVPAAAFTFLTYYAWDRWRREKQNGWFYTMILFTGAAVASKLTAVIVLPLVFFGIVWECRKTRDTAGVFKKILIFIAGISAFLLPWWGRNYLASGNPLVPYMMQFFGGERGINWDVSRSLQQMQYYKAFGLGHELLDFFLLPYRLTFLSETDSLRFDGKIGVLYILFIPALFWMRKRLLPLGIVFSTLMTFWFIHFQYIRLLTPAFAFLSIFLVACLENMTRIPPKSQTLQNLTNIAGRTLILALTLGILYNLSLIVKEWRRFDPIPYLLHQETRDQYLSRHIPSYPLFQAVNAQTDQDAVVLFIYMRNLGFLSDRKFISDTFFEAHTMRRIIQRDSSSGEISARLKNLGVTHVMFDNRYVFGEDSVFSLEEREALMRFLNAKTTLALEKNGRYLYRLMIN